MLFLPTIRPFTPGALRWRLVDARVEGPDGFGLPPVAVTTDGGGWWTADFGELKVAAPEHHRMMRAMALRLRGGARVEVPFVEQYPPGGLDRTSFDDGADFSDGAQMTSGQIAAVLESPVAVRDDTCVIHMTSGHRLLGGDVFSLSRGVLGSELHMTDSVEDLGDNRWRVVIGPQFRAAHAAGTELEFNTPHCAMRLDDPDGGMWPTIEPGWRARATMKLVEAIS